MHRRDFLQTTSRVGSAAGIALTATSWSQVLGANDRIQLGAIGLGVRGRYVLESFLKVGSVEVRAVCDTWSAQLGEAMRIAPGAKSYRDYRKMIEGERLDAVMIATPDHWHAQTASDALNAGLDVYVEKPLTLAVSQGPALVKAARINKRICQVGTQYRSAPGFLRLKREYFDARKLGKVTLIRTWYNGNRYHARQAPDYLRNKPDSLDWITFLGPLTWREWDAQQYWNWRAYLDFGGGQVTDLFVHLVDIVHMLTGQDDPVSAVASGGVYYYKDGRTAPDTITLTLEYRDDYVVTFEASIVPGAQGAGLEFSGSDGRLVIDWPSRGRTLFYDAEGGSKPIEVLPAGEDPTVDHVKNFLTCVGTRDLPNADVHIGHRSAQAAHLGTAAYLEKRHIKFDPVREQVFPL